jgi:hypothetical protein
MKWRWRTRMEKHCRDQTHLHMCQNLTLSGSWGSVFVGVDDVLFIHVPDGNPFPVTIDLLEELEQQCLDGSTPTS